MSYLRLVSLVTCTALTLVGCERGDGVEAAFEASAESCRMEATPAILVGGIDPPAHIFGEVSDAVRLSNGQIAVADRQARSVSIFNAQAELIRTLGREGEGPGEFLDPIGVVVKGNAILVWDWDQARVTKFDLATDEVGVYRVEGFANPTDHFGDLPGGFVVGSIGFPGGLPESGSWTNELGVLRWDSLQSSLDTLVSFRYRSSEWVDHETRMSGSKTFSAKGTFVAGDGRVYWSEGDSAIVHFWDDGVIGSISWTWPTRSVMPGDVDLYRERWLARVPENAHAAITEMIAKLPVAEVFPTVSELVADVDGGVWVGIYPAPADSAQTWLRFRDGELTCRVEFPLPFQPTEGGSNWLLGVRKDELDVQRVELWSLDSG